jgi:pyruvate formate lyase activating enzyme
MRTPVSNIQKFSLHDGPGIRTTVFLEGCPLSCDWCQNPETVHSYPKVVFNKGDCVECLSCIEICDKNCFQLGSGIEFDSTECNQCGICVEECRGEALRWSSKQLSVDDVLKEILKDKPYYDISGGGLTISGGEPLNHPGFCLELAYKAKQQGIHVAVDTCGLVSPVELKKVKDSFDLFLFDLKFIDNTLHQTYAHASNSQILKNFEILVRSGKEIEVRVPLIPNITDSQDNLRKIEDFVRAFNYNIKIIHVPFNYLYIDKYKMIGKTPPFLRPL